MHRCIIIILHDFFRNNNGIFVVVTIPRHICHAKIASYRKFTIIDRLSVSQDLSFCNFLSSEDTSPLMYDHSSIGNFESAKWICLFFSVSINHRNMLCIDTNHFPISLCLDHISRTFTHHAFHTSTNDWRFRTHERHCLAHHVRTHFRASRIIVFKEWNEHCRFRHELLWRNIDMRYI